MTIRDTVSYSGLEAGRKYVLKGTLNYRRNGKLHTVSADGEPLAETVEFIPDTSEGTETVTFDFDGAYLAGETLVVFEELYDGDTLIAEHRDINDEGQSVRVPEIRTSVRGKVGKDGKYVIDRVKYSNLIPGRTYRVKGYFVKKEDGSRVEDSDGEITFTPEKASGKIDVELMPGDEKSDLVAFESVYLIEEEDEEHAVEREILVGEHKDINDSSQTYSVIRSPKTGDDNRFPVYMVLLSAAVIAVTAICKRREVYK